MRISAFVLPSLCVSSFLFVLSASAATPVDIDALITAALSAPAEFSSDALIRIASLDKLEKNRRIELLAQAFERAGAAQQPYKRHAASVRLDGSAAYWNRVYNQDLDALSLRLRAVESMLPLDGQKARELFQQIPPLATPRVKCTEFQVYDVGRFYDVLGSLVQQGFTAGESADGAPFQLLKRYAGALTSPVQAAPMAHVIATAKVNDADFETLVSSFSGALGKISGDDRSFVYAITVGREVKALVEECKRRQLSPLPLIESYRLYLVINLSSARCADDDLMQGGKQSFGVFTAQPTEQQAGDFVSYFNKELRLPPLQEIHEEEATPSRMEGFATGMRACQDAPCRSMVEQYRGLVFGPGGSPYLPADREKPAWQANLRAMLTNLSEWKESGGATPAEYFREKCAVYADLLSLTPTGSNRDSILQAALAFVGGNVLQATNRLEWFLPVNALIGRVGLDPLGLGKFGDELRKASDPLIAMYAKLEAVAPRTPDRILSLL